MRLATRTGLAAMAAVTFAVVVVSAVAVIQFQRSLFLRVDQDLNERAESAAVLAAVGDRIAVSELSPTIFGARVQSDAGASLIGRLPPSGLPPTSEPGFRTVSVDGEDWRILTVIVDDVPTVGASTTVDLVAPLGNVETQALRLRRRSILVGLVVAAAAGVVGILLGRRATAPLSELRQDVARIGAVPGGEAVVAGSYEAADVDEVAGAINHSLQRLAEETKRREAALGAARSFAAAASHELRTPLQAAMAQLDLALTDTDQGASDQQRADSMASARHQLDRMGSALSAVRALTDVDLVESSWFVEADLSELADQAVGSFTARELDGASIRFSGDEVAPGRFWPDGAALAIENVVRNALRHGRPLDGTPLVVTVAIDASGQRVIVDDNGPGIPEADRSRLVLPFERGSTHASGSGLGLAFVAKVADVHGGSLAIGTGPTGGTRVVVAFVADELGGLGQASSVASRRSSSLGSV